MDDWRRIWNGKAPDLDKLNSHDLESVFMELKRMTGNDTTGKGVSYEALIDRFKQFQRELTFGENSYESVFEVGCGSGANLLLFQKQGYKVGGLDYSKALIDVAAKILDNPVELENDEAINIIPQIKYDIVFSNSAFEYFADEEYASRVLEKMHEKANKAIGILEVHDVDLKEEFVNHRRATIENYDEKYKNLGKLFLSKKFFLDFADKKRADIKICYPKIEGYWNTDYIFDVYLYKN